MIVYSEIYNYYYIPGRCGFLTNAEYQTRILPDPRIPVRLGNRTYRGCSHIFIIYDIDYFVLL